MITDEKTNFLYVADKLKNLAFWQIFKPVLEAQNIPYAFLPGTNDIWCRDFMPVQTSDNRFVQFVYQPEYLQKEPYFATISDPEAICRELGIETVKTDIKLDGGNVVKSEKKAILTDRIFKENPEFDKTVLQGKIQELLQVEQLFIIPEQPGDFSGHADGMVRFLNEDTLLVNDFSTESKSYRERLAKALKATGLNLETCLYKPDQSLSRDSAVGTYINFLQIGKVIFLPVFDKPEDDEAAINQTEILYPGCTVVPVFSNDIARDGGILNCIAWNIRK